MRPVDLPTPPVVHSESDLEEFLLVLRDALLMIVRWIEKRYHLDRHKTK